MDVKHTDNEEAITIIQKKISVRGRIIMVLGVLLAVVLGIIVVINF